MENKPEVWLRGPIEGIDRALQPVAHALLQAKDEIHSVLDDLPEGLLWKQPGGVASVAFHLQHIVGVLDRLFTYAKAEQLSNSQLKYLSEEVLELPTVTKEKLLDQLDQKINESVSFLKNIDPAMIFEKREVGRKKLPSTTLGLLFHSAEHTMRHTGQLLATAKILKSEI
jgi:uncharacterized damage-inducible protein DinB